ncbi:hypothetical protein [Catellatospora sp. NPDC049609]|uniref:hypothetical protein n=1 Tax=Catellatospora sp. NPDC049609 TaxID=3155505 RepID=UPI0034274DD9
MPTPPATVAETTQTAPLPYATLLAFTRYVDRSGPAKAAFVGRLRRQRETGGGFNPHSRLIKALKTDIDQHTPGTHLTEVNDQVDQRWQRLYAALTAGAASYLTSIEGQGVRLTRTNDALAMIGNLPVRISAHFGLRYEDGHSEAVRLHFDEEAPTADLITATLHLLRSNMDQILPHAEPVLVDVRRGIAYRGEAGTGTDVDRWLTGEAAGFAAMWNAPHG